MKKLTIDVPRAQHAIDNPVRRASKQFREIGAKNHYRQIGGVASLRFKMIFEFRRRNQVAR